MEAMEPFAILGVSLNFASDQSEGKANPPSDLKSTSGLSP